MSVTIELDESTREATLTILGDFNFEQQESLVEVFRGLDSDLKRCRVDLRRVKHLDSTALWSLLEIRALFGDGQKDRVSIVYSANGLIEEALQVTQLGELFTLKPEPLSAQSSRSSTP